MFLVKIINTAVDNLNRRVAKFFRFGKSDVQKKIVASPYGVDSNPIEGTVAIYAKTEGDGDAFIIGYLNKNAIADIGEHRIFSTDSDGNVSTFIHLKNDGTMEVGGSDDNIIGYSQTASSINEIKDDINNLKSTLSDWEVVPQDGGAALKTALSTYVSQTLTEDISQGKKEKIKTL